MNKARLAMLLEEVPGFPQPKRRLEQYPTPGEIAADLVLKAFFKGDIEGRVVADLGAGTGRLGYAALLLGARQVIFVDLDHGALEASRGFLGSRNLLHRADHLASDATRIHWARGIDTVLQNPPFGYSKRHLDLEFLRAAARLGKTVYSLHAYNPVSRKVICREAERLGYTCSVIATYRFPIGQIYRDHYKRLHTVIVDAYMLRRVTGSGEHG